MVTWHFFFLCISSVAGVPRSMEKAQKLSLAKPHRASLLRTRWNWKTASMESLTEWAIVLKRYYMVDMELADLVRDIPAALPVSPHSGEAQSPPAQEDVARLHAKARKLSAHLKAAMNDERTSDNTFTDMQIDKHLNSTEKQILNTEHEKQWQSAQELAALGATAEKSAEALLVEIDRPPTAPMRKQVHGVLRGNQSRSVIVNTTALAVPGAGRNATQVAAAAALGLFAKFQEQVAAFSAHREALEKTMKARTAVLMGLGWKLSKVIVADLPSSE